MESVASDTVPEAGVDDATESNDPIVAEEATVAGVDGPERAAFREFTGGQELARVKIR